MTPPPRPPPDSAESTFRARTKGTGLRTCRNMTAEQLFKIGENSVPDDQRELAAGLAEAGFEQGG